MYASDVQWSPVDSNDALKLRDPPFFSFSGENSRLWYVQKFLSLHNLRTADDEEYRILQTCSEYICGHNLGDLLTTAYTFLNSTDLVGAWTSADSRAKHWPKAELWIQRLGISVTSSITGSLASLARHISHSGLCRERGISFRFPGGKRVFSYFQIILSLTPWKVRISW
jgi:hypothetical protein